MNHKSVRFPPVSILISFSNGYGTMIEYMSLGEHSYYQFYLSVLNLRLEIGRTLQPFLL